eukprot:CAMPEP_0170251694 /NCGR_PEP_ID=MMETSP0116_2-20130129/25677_1 /TAXON_ID=400756 /ORGANISM="Durinskia baltica, Strain CSIRO CS-38" /LENGTH=96 /DNA_ID=CAMNT_0010502657 /DNA_START=379 /DNA_END=666 /DNA_ORIENTATION=+
MKAGLASVRAGDGLGRGGQRRNSYYLAVRLNSAAPATDMACLGAAAVVVGEGTSSSPVEAGDRNLGCTWRSALSPGPRSTPLCSVPPKLGASLRMT